MRRATLWMITAGSFATCAAACSSSKPNDTPVACTSSFDAIIAASDYSSSAFGGCDLDGGASLPFSGVDIQDPALATSGNHAFLIARETDLVFELDPHCATPRAKYGASEPSYAGYANPQDVAVTSTGDLWIPRFNVPTLLVLDANGNRVTTIDLSSQDPEDGNPNASAIRLAQVGGADKAFVALERLDDHAKFASTRPSSMIRIDVATRAVEATATLQGRDPFGAIAESSGAFFLAAPGSFYAIDEKDAGIERFDPQTFTTTYLLGESELGASVTEVAVNGSCGVAIVADPTTLNATSLVTFDADRGAAITTAKNPVLATAGFDLAGLAWRGDELMVGDRRRAGGNYPIHVFDKSGACNLTERPDAIFISLPPLALRTATP